MRSGHKSRGAALLAVAALVFSLLPALAAAQDGEPAVLALFDFEGDTPQPAVVHPAFEVGPMTVNRGTVNFFGGNPGRAMATNEWHEDNNYFQFVVTPPPEGVSLTAFSFDEAGSSTAPNEWAVSIVDDPEGDDPDEIEVASGAAPGTTSPLVFSSQTVDLTGHDELRTEPFAMRLRGFDASGPGGNWRIDNVTLSGLTDAVSEPVLALQCDAPLTITEGFAAEDGPFVAGKAITANATGGTGDFAFAVTEVTPDPDPGEVTVTTVDGPNAEARFSDDVPGLDPRTTSGTYAVTIEVTDADEETATCTVDVRVVPVLSIGEMRGAVPDDANGRTYVSPYALGTPIFLPHPNHIAIRGVVTQRTLEENPASQFNFEGFFVQSLDADPADIDGFGPGDPVFADGDPNTSDGVWVSTGTFSTVRPDFPTTPPQPQMFLEESGLARSRPEARIEFSRPTGYVELLELVKTHGYHVMVERREVVPIEDIAADWYDWIYLPAIEAFAREGLREAFPDRTDGDLFLWIWQRRRALFPERGGLTMEEAARLARAEQRRRRLRSGARRPAKKLTNAAPRPGPENEQTD
jgi:hypothetical protein